MINVADVLNDPDFATTYKVIRSTGKWVAGRFQLTGEEVLNFYGPVQPARTKDLEQLPEGDRQKEVTKFFCTPPNELHISCEETEENEEHKVVSDIVEYKRNKYKIIQVSPWGQNGFYRAFGVRIGG